jgi:rhodanese-related sulfurtransferase
MSDTTAIPEVEVDEARRRTGDGALLLDVREPDEWAAGHAPEAVHIPMGEITEGRDRLPTDRPILAICRSGARSARVTAALVTWGFDAANVAGGMQAWAATGLDIVTDDGTPGHVA